MKESILLSDAESDESCHNIGSPPYFQQTAVENESCSKKPSEHKKLRSEHHDAHGSPHVNYSSNYFSNTTNHYINYSVYKKTIEKVLSFQVLTAIGKRDYELFPLLRQNKLSSLSIKQFSLEYTLAFKLLCLSTFNSSSSRLVDGQTRLCEDRVLDKVCSLIDLLNTLINCAYGHRNALLSCYCTGITPSNIIAVAHDNTNLELCNSLAEANHHCSIVSSYDSDEYPGGTTLNPSPEVIESKRTCENETAGLVNLRKSYYKINSRTQYNDKCSKDAWPIEPSLDIVPNPFDYLNLLFNFEKSLDAIFNLLQSEIVSDHRFSSPLNCQYLCSFFTSPTLSNAQKIHTYFLDVLFYFKKTFSLKNFALFRGETSYRINVSGKSNLKKKNSLLNKRKYVYRHGVFCMTDTLHTQSLVERDITANKLVRKEKLSISYKLGLSRLLSAQTKRLQELMKGLLFKAILLLVTIFFLTRRPPLSKV
ncbi:hypothetical protein Zmor_012424 [Zophobas morio]|uniref:Uncharacterized protein n=1 Tax=Zophobas morio TaxID=2755281 RepID=A0AA38LYR7_9CUCU|nr:hypothetical protein Zmor_012424 [Zophobas morio]